MAKTKYDDRTRQQIASDVLKEKEELYSSTYDRYHDEDDLKVVDKEGNLIGIYGKIFKKIKEELNGKH